MSGYSLVQPRRLFRDEFASLEAELADLEWEVAVDRRRAEYVRWVQRSLNQVLGLRLAVDGKIGPRTRSAIRQFQQRQGLRDNGIVYDKMERALVAAGALPPAGGGTAPVRGSPGPITANNPRGPFGTLTVIGGRRPFSYTFTPEDVLWTARFIVGEAGGRDDVENRAVIWAMFNRFAFFTHTVYPTFHAFLRRYSTPLQPVLNSKGAAKRHMHRPEFVRTGGFYPGTSIPRGQLQRHLRLQQTPWHQLPSGARALAENALMGRVPNPGIGNASDFADTAVYFRDKYGRTPTFDEWARYTQELPKITKKKRSWIGHVSGLKQYRVNSFFLDDRVRNLPPNAVRVT